MISLGIIGLVLRDFQRVWGRLPDWVPSPMVLAVACALVALAAGIALLFRRTAATASMVAFVYVALWWLLFKVPPVVRMPLIGLTWVDGGMHAMLLAGAWTRFADVGGRPFPGGERGMRFARLLFGLSLIPVGLSHFAYLSLTVPLIPTWLPFRTGWAYFTGACHLAAGLGVLFGVLPRLAAQLESLMLALFTIIVWIPRVVAAPRTPLNWAEIWISWALTAAAAVVAAGIPPHDMAPNPPPRAPETRAREPLQHW